MEGLEASVVNSGVVKHDKRLDAQFFKKTYLVEAHALHLHTLRALGQLAFITDGPHGYHEVDIASPIAMLTAKSATSWFAGRQGADTIARWVDDANPRSSLRVNDLILSTRGTVGNCAVVTSETLPANIDQDVARIASADGSSCQPFFLLAYLNGRFGQDYVARHSTGMVQQGLSLAAVRSFPVPVLTDRFQAAITRVVDEALREKRTGRTKHTAAADTLLAALGPGDWRPTEPLAYTARATTVAAAKRLDAQYFMPAKERVCWSLAQLPGRPLADIVVSVRDMLVPHNAPSTMWVRNYDVTDALQPLLGSNKRVSRAVGLGSVKKVLVDGDVVISRLRAYLREIAVVRAGDDVPSVGSSEFIVLRLSETRCEMDPETLMVFLRSLPVQMVLKWCQDGSQHPRFSEGDLVSIPVPDVVGEASGRIAALVRQGFAAEERVRRLLDTAKRAVEVAIEDGELGAFAYLDRSMG